jgi:hypothetical protein
MCKHAKIPSLTCTRFDTADLKCMPRQSLDKCPRLAAELLGGWFDE